jgi:adenylate kinase
LVPEEITTKVVASFLDNNLKNGIIFDGYPRTKEQLEILKGMLKKRQASIDKVFFIDISEKEIKKRLSGRLVCPKCGESYNILTEPSQKEGLCDLCRVKLVRRKDENPKAIKKRLSVYQKETYPLLEIYRQMGILEEVNGERPIEVIFEDILSRLKKAALVP